MQDAHPFQGCVDATAGSGFAGRSQNLQVLPAGQMGMEPRFVHDRRDPGQRHVPVPGNQVRVLPSARRSL